jgi:twinkle protein
MLEDREMEPGKRALSDSDAQWIEEARKIPVEIAVEFGLHSRDGAICFPFHDAHGVEVYCKHRTRDKRIWRSPKGIDPVLWGLPSLAEATGNGDDRLVWVEGEFDKLAAHVAGETWVVSVPDGAQAADVCDAPPATDTTFRWLWDKGGKLLSGLDKFRKHVIVVDNDEKGRILATNLSIRLGRARCWYVTWPTGCKDLNDVLIKHGADTIGDMLDGAKPLVPSRLVSFADIPRSPNQVQYSSGWSDLDQHFRLKCPELITVVGAPNAGKSQWVLALVANLARVHALRGAIIQFEDDVDRNRDDLIRYATAWKNTSAEGVPIEMDPEQWVAKMFVTLSPSEGDEDLTLDWLRDTIFEAVKRHGCQYIVLDPWNELEHMWGRNESETLYTRNALRQIKRWGRQLQVVIIVVVHPSKASGNDKPIDDWNLYDAEGSNSWNNKSDHGIVIWRESSEAVETYVKVCKSKDFRRMGVPGTVVMTFEQRLGTYKFLRRHISWKR